MGWIGTAGFALLLVSIGILGSVLPGLWAEKIGRARPRVYDPGSLEARLQDDILRKRSRLSSPRVLALVSGPRNTPEPTIYTTAVNDFAEDRAVDVWAVWSWHNDQ
jgi:hypothetical protein